MMRTYDSYKDSGIEWIGEIPSHWKKTKTKYFSTFCNGYSFNSEDWTDSGIPVIRMSNIGIDGKIKITSKNLNYVNHKNKHDNFLIKKGDILISMTDMNPEMLWLGSTILFFEDGDWYLNQRVGSIRISNGLVNVTFYHYLSNTDVVRNQLKLSVYPNVQTNLSVDPIKNELIFLPPLSEQEQIVSYLDEKTSLIDEMVEKKKRKIELLKEYRTSLINTVVTKGLNPDVPMKDSGIEWIGEIPRHWDCVKISWCVRVKDGTHDTPEYIDEGGIPLVTQKDISSGILDFTKTKRISLQDYENINKRSDVQKNDILMSMIGSIGNPTIVNTKVPFSIKNLCLFKTSESNDNIKYVFYILSSDFLDKELSLESKGGVQGFVPLEVLRNLSYLKIPITEQEQIVTYLDEKTSEIDKTIELENKKIELLKEYRQSLISNLVTGKIKVTIQ